VFKRAHHLSLSWCRYIQFTPSRPLTPSFILILSSHLRLGLPSCLFASDFVTEILYEFLIATVRATRPTNLITLDLITLMIFGVAYKLWSSPPLFSVAALRRNFFAPPPPHPHPFLLFQTGLFPFIFPVPYLCPLPKRPHDDYNRIYPNLHI
jgi:hypothetical protein